MADPETEKKPCVYCRSMMPVQATYCKECSKHQRRFKNWSVAHSVLVAGFFGLMTAFGLAMKGVIQDYTAVTKVEVLGVTYMPNGTAAIANLGDNDVLLRSLTVECEALGFHRETIAHTHLYGQHTGLIQLRPGLPASTGLQDVNDVTLEELQLLQKHHRFCVCSFDWNVFDKSHLSEPSGCLPASPTFTVPAKAKLKFYSYVDKKDFESSMDCFLTLRQFSTAEGQFVDYRAEIDRLTNGKERSTAKPIVE